MPLYRPDGTPFGTLCALDPNPAPLTEQDFAIFRLLADLITFELVADEQQQRRERALRAMEDFVAVAVHDLRQPLTALYGRAQLLARRAQRGATAEELALAAMQVAGHAHRASVLSDMLLDLARIDTGAFALAQTSVDLVDLASQAIADVQFTAPNHFFQLDAPASLAWIADAARLSQVLRNLLENAAKYAPAEAGPIRVEVRRIEADAGECAQIRISDRGVGVAEAELPQLFERTYRTADAIARGISGTGMGLYIARVVAEAHGGQIWAEQHAGGGLAICLQLPEAAAAR